jgi:hypothetical protein
LACPTWRAHAAERVLDRLEGKPTQKTENTTRVTLETLIRRAIALPAPPPDPPTIEATPEGNAG